MQLKDYLMAEALWDPTIDANATITKFLSGYYADAAPFIQSYMNTWNGAIDDTEYYMRESFDVDADFLQPKRVGGAGSLGRLSKKIPAR